MFCVCYMAVCALMSYRWVGEVVSRVGGCGFGVVLECCGGFIELVGWFCWSDVGWFCW